MLLKLLTIYFLNYSLSEEIFKTKKVWIFGYRSLEIHNLNNKVSDGLLLKTLNIYEDKLYCTSTMIWIKRGVLRFLVKTGLNIFTVFNISSHVGPKVTINQRR